MASENCDVYVLDFRLNFHLTEFSSFSSELITYRLTVGFGLEKCDVQFLCFSISSLLFNLRSGFSGLQHFSYLERTTPFCLPSDGTELERIFDTSPDPFIVTPFGMDDDFERVVPFT